MTITVIHIALCLACLPLFVVVPATLVYALAGRRLGVERGEHPLYEARCGGRIGNHSHRIPFLRIAVYESFVVLAGRRRYHLPVEAIERVAVVGTRTPRTVQIHHHATGVPQPLEVWVEEVEPLVAAMAIE